MTLEDLEYIFKPQIDTGATSLYFMLIDGDQEMVLRQESNELVTLLPLLDSFQYNGTDSTLEKMPRFLK